MPSAPTSATLPVRGPSGQVMPAATANPTLRKWLYITHRMVSKHEDHSKLFYSALLTQRDYCYIACGWDQVHLETIYGGIAHVWTDVEFEGEFEYGIGAHVTILGHPGEDLDEMSVKLDTRKQFFNALRNLRDLHALTPPFLKVNLSAYNFENSWGLYVEPGCQAWHYYNAIQHAVAAASTTPPASYWSAFHISLEQGPKTAATAAAETPLFPASNRTL